MAHATNFGPVAGAAPDGAVRLSSFYQRAGIPEQAQRDELIAALDEHAIVSVADTSGKIIYVNDLFCQVSGYCAIELLGAQHNIVKSGAHPPGFYADLWDTISSGRVWQGEIENRRKDGSHYWVSTTIVPVLDDQGLPVRYVSIRTDISRERALNQELARQRAFLGGLAEAVGEGILVEDATGLCVFANQEAAQLLGCAREQLLGRRLCPDIVKSLGPVDFARTSLPTGFGVEPGWQPGRFEGVFVGLDGHELPVRVHVSPMSARQGEGEAEYGLVIAFRDNSEDLRQHAVLARARAAADQANRAKSAFLANMSHEIRTPLNGVLGLAHLALDEALDPALRREYLQGIVDSAGALAQLLSDVLDLSKIEAGMLHIEVAEFDLHALLHSTLQIFRESASTKGLLLQLRIDAGVPQHVIGDALRVRQIITNFMANAVKFTATGRVELAASPAGDDRLRLAVSDTGIGIESQALERLFRPFTQADQSTTRRFGGSGLGLSICRELAQRMGGATGADSVVGQGSCFWAELPLRPAPAPAIAGGGAPAAASEAGDLSGLRVLLVEDNPINSMIAGAMMTKWNVQVTGAESGREALELVERERGQFDLVLLDLHMPDLGGIDVAKALRGSYSADALPIVALTAAAFEEDRQRCLRAGMNDFLAKPFDPEGLRALLIRWGLNRQ